MAEDAVAAAAPEPPEAPGSPETDETDETAGAGPGIALLLASRNRRPDLVRTLDRMVPLFMDRSTGRNHPVAVVDDGSTDGTAEAVAERFPGVILFRHGASRGYIAGRNRLLDRAADGLLESGSGESGHGERGHGESCHEAEAPGPVELAVSLDDDSEIVSPDALEVLERHFAAHPRSAVAAFALHWDTEAPSPDAVEAARRAGTDGDPGSPPTAWPVNGFVGCGHAWRLDAWREVGPYPEWLEVYGEEAWATLALVRRGWEVHQLPGVLVHHRVRPGERAPEDRARRGRLQLRAGLAVMLTAYPLGALPRRFAYAVARQLTTRLGRGDLTVLPDLAWVAGSLLARLPQILAWRRPLSRDAWRRFQALDEVAIYRPPAAPGL